MTKNIPKRTFLTGLAALWLTPALAGGRLPGLDDEPKTKTRKKRARKSKAKSRTKSSRKTKMSDSKRFTRIRQLKSKLRVLEFERDEARRDEKKFSYSIKKHSDKAAARNKERVRLKKKISDDEKVANHLTKKLRRGRNPDGSKMTIKEKDDLVRQINPLNKRIRQNVEQEKQVRKEVKAERRAASKAQVNKSREIERAKKIGKDINKVKAELKSLQ